VICTLADLKPGEAGVVAELLCEGDTRARFLDLGLVPETTVRVAYDGPLGDPTAYEIRGSLIAIRDEDAQFIRVRRVN